MGERESFCGENEKLDSDRMEFDEEIKPSAAIGNETLLLQFILERRDLNVKKVSISAIQVWFVFITLLKIEITIATSKQRELSCSISQPLPFALSLAS